jgi:hypothetical protein
VHSLQCVCDWTDRPALFARLEAEVRPRPPALPCFLMDPSQTLPVPWLRMWCRALVEVGLGKPACSLPRGPAPLARVRPKPRSLLCGRKPVLVTSLCGLPAGGRAGQPRLAFTKRSTLGGLGSPSSRLLQQARHDASGDLPTRARSRRCGATWRPGGCRPCSRSTRWPTPSRPSWRSQSARSARALRPRAPPAPPHVFPGLRDGRRRPCAAVAPWAV